jgi:hypothetical protein
VAGISTKSLTRLPNVHRLRGLLRSMAMLDAILSPAWETRFYSFDSQFNEGEELASMRDGRGAEFYACFSTYGCLLKGYAPNAIVAKLPSIAVGEHYRGLPNALVHTMHIPALHPQQVTFCIWRSMTDKVWHRNCIPLPVGADPDGSAALLGLLDGQAESYMTWAEAYYRRPVPLSAVEAIYEHQPLKPQLLLQLNPNISPSDLADDIHIIGYPT